MSNRYTDHQKETALSHLDANYGNVTLTALQTGIPTRTLYTWKRERKLHRQQIGLPLQHKKSALPPPQTAAPQTHPESEYTRIRARLMEHINNLLETLTDDPDTAHLRIIALTRLLDRVIKLEALTHTEGTQVIRVEFYHPDGSLHPYPDWAPHWEDTPTD